MEHHGKNLSWPRGDLNPRRWYQSTDMLATRPSGILKKKGASSPELRWLKFLRCQESFFNDVP